MANKIWLQIPQNNGVHSSTLGMSKIYSVVTQHFILPIEAPAAQDSAQVTHPPVLQFLQILQPHTPVHHCDLKVGDGHFHVILVVVTKMPGNTTGCPPPVSDVSCVLVPPVPHTILRTSDIVWWVSTGTEDVINCQGGQAVQPFVDVVSSVVIQWPDMVHCMQVTPLM